MSKIGLVLKREYSTRVRKKSFIVMTILGPLLFGGFFAGLTWMMSLEDTEVRTIAVVDSTRMFINQLPETENLKFVYVHNTPVETLKKTFFLTDYYAVLYIPHIITYAPNSVMLYSDKQPSVSIKMHITQAIEKQITDEKLKAYDLENLDEILKSVETNVGIQTIKLMGDGQEKRGNSELATGLAYVGGLLIYIFIFMFGAQVMRGVIEEKSNRIVEVIISSVKPFQLMMGKIIGIALIGLTQFVLWVVLTFFIINIVQQQMIPDASELTQKQAPMSILSPQNSPAGQANGDVAPVFNDDYDEIKEIMGAIGQINWPLIIFSFVFFFLGGYLLYGSLFAAIGSMVDSETDTQQFMFPVTVPLIFALVVMFNSLANPESDLTWWCSFIPFTSPIVMMARLPFGVPNHELFISMALLVLFFIGSTWFAGKIYRTGILMYGKKASYKELIKWLRYKNS